MIRHTPVRKPTAVDLFAGCGGLTQGLVTAGFDVLGAVELHELACESYAMNHPDVRLVRGDIRSVDMSELRRSLSLELGDLDLLAGCPPCQGFSAIRTRNRAAVSDPRNALIREMLRAASAFLPKTIMMENVPNLVKFPEFKSFLEILENMGYQIGYEVMDVADFGVPQRRKRLVVLASRSGKIAIHASNKIKRTVREAIGYLECVSDLTDPLHNTFELRSAKIQRLIAAIPKDGGSRSALPSEWHLECHKKVDGFSDVYGRMRWDDVAPTITGGCVNPSRGRFLHPSENRAITLREAALLQSFPPTYKFSLRKGKYAAAQMIGNALPPAFSQVQASAIAQHLALHYDLSSVTARTAVNVSRSQ